jgi:two-component sensor histidine kinase
MKRRYIRRLKRRYPNIRIVVLLKLRSDRRCFALAACRGADTVIEPGLRCAVLITAITPDLHRRQLERAFCPVSQGTSASYVVERDLGTVTPLSSSNHTKRTRQGDLPMQYRVPMTGERSDPHQVDSKRKFIGVERDIAEREKRVEKRQRLLIAELNHRMRNTLATMGMIVELSRSSAASVDAFADALSGRINALARTYARLSGSSRMGARLRDLIEDELAPYRSQTNVCVEGRDLALNLEPAQALALVLHELVTNAVKHGALSTADGGVAVRWQVAGEMGSARLILVWQEAGGPTLVTPKRQGFGTRLIHNMLHHELGGRVELSLPPTGLRCEMEVPLARVGGKDD